ncbi:unnamed protein product, partial [Eruca vesicaria subsp. sativa]|nr:unnamed protein product [Eruca vesicaria subsp. sativa]
MSSTLSFSYVVDVILQLCRRRYPSDPPSTLSLSYFFRLLNEICVDLFNERLDWYVHDEERQLIYMLDELQRDELESEMPVPTDGWLLLYVERTRNIDWMRHVSKGKVLVDEKRASKAGKPVANGVSIKITAEVPKYVCRGGLKLEAGIEKLDFDVSEKVVLDSGFSTGGFTDCLLRYGAAHVYGVDVGY